MTQEEIISQIKQLPVEQKVEILEAVAQDVRAELRANGSSTTTDVGTDQASREEKLAAFQRLRGLLKTERTPPTDEELKEDYVNYLSEKYS